MTAAAPAPGLRARSTPQLLDALVAVARGATWDLFALSVLWHLPVHIFRLAAGFAGRGSLLERASPEIYLGTLWWSIWNSLAVGATAVAACQWCLDGHTSIRDALTGMRSAGWRFLGTIAVVAVFLDGPYALALASGPFPGVFLLAAMFAAIPWCAPAVPAAWVERVVPWAAVRRSLWLVRGNFWRVAIVLWSVWLVTYIADSGLVSTIYSWTHRTMVSRVADVVVDGALYPLRGIALALVYLDCRVRREAFDLERILDSV